MAGLSRGHEIGEFNVYIVLARYQAHEIRLYMLERLQTGTQSGNWDFAKTSIPSLTLSQGNE